MSNGSLLPKATIRAQLLARMHWLLTKSALVARTRTAEGFTGLGARIPTCAVLTCAQFQAVVSQRDLVGVTGMDSAEMVRRPQLPRDG